MHAIIVTVQTKDFSQYFLSSNMMRLSYQANSKLSTSLVVIVIKVSLPPPMGAHFSKVAIIKVIFGIIVPATTSASSSLSVSTIAAAGLADIHTSVILLPILWFAAPESKAAACTAAATFHTVEIVRGTVARRIVRGTTTKSTTAAAVGIAITEAPKSKVSSALDRLACNSVLTLEFVGEW